MSALRMATTLHNPSKGKLRFDPPTLVREGDLGACWTGLRLEDGEPTSDLRRAWMRLRIYRDGAGGEDREVGAVAPSREGELLRTEWFDNLFGIAKVVIRAGCDAEAEHGLRLHWYLARLGELEDPDSTWLAMETRIYVTPD